MIWNVHPATQLLDANGGELESLYLGVTDQIVSLVIQKIIHINNMGRHLSE